MSKLLTGEAVDEMLAGYYRYRKTIYNLSFGARYHQLTNEGLRRMISRRIENLSAGSIVRRN